ncbi:hypothetical protein SAMN05661091_5753 [Paenibacillus uliginis N3/975]|uniref:ATPase involved in DNA repair n=1 Tax=Paenibacillus uliginis N3/975 TaxID=1313296 RepID=A0A1X7HSV5_9BACL|nr:hypothetical protein [Paenibacillus uliginis]SMF92272.1 hypothetical protein SAMN05661091_5753 [Paenibacillus uliginis N3/975]
MHKSIGSTWKRWDLHVHTPESVLNMQYKFENTEESTQYGEQIWGKYIDKLESADSSVSVVGITDYCSIDGFERVMEYKDKGRLKNFDLILANVEFRIVPITDKNKAINVHCIFSNELTVQDIRRFLDELKYDYNGSKYRCNKDDLSSLGKAFNPALLNESDCYKEGVNQFKVNVNDLKNLIETEQRYKDKIFIVASNSSSDGISGLKDNSIASTRQELYRNVHFIFSGNNNDCKYFLGQGIDSKDEVIRKCGTLKACLHGSDAHDFDKLFKPDLDRFCWIKGEPTFAGLRQLLFEPDTRVRIQKDEPDSKKNIFSLKRFKMNAVEINQELGFNDVNLQFNKNLVAVIGGKGSGKTAVLDLIANCYSEYDRSRHYDLRGRATNNNNEDQNSFVQRIEKDCSDLEVSIDFLDDQTSFTKKLTENTFFSNGQVRYLPQGKIEEVAGNTKAMHKDIQNLIFTQLSKIDDYEYRSYIEMDNKILQVNREIATLIAEIDILIAETSPEIIEGLNRQLEIKKGELKDRVIKLLDFEGTLTRQEEEDTLKLTGKLKELDKQFEIAKEFISDCENLAKELDEIQVSINAQIERLNQQNSQLVIEEVSRVDFSNILAAINKNKVYATIGKLDLEDQRKKHTEDIKSFTGRQSEQAVLLKEKGELEKAKEEIIEKISEIRKKQSELDSKVVELNTKYEELLLNYKGQQNSYDRIIEAYKSSEKDILQNIDFKAEVYFDRTQFEELADDIFDKRKLPSEFLDQTGSNIIGYLENSTDIDITSYKLIVKYLRKNKTIFDYFKWLTHDYFQLDTKVYFNDVELSKLSVGQKGAVILKLYLADGDYPIILDQPEDNLDNRFISEELLTTFRKAKEKRQIIIATHNANLVVNSDAEQIIVADFIDNKILYRAGSIENFEIRKEVASLLEGGEEAFKQRESKYGFSK